MAQVSRAGLSPQRLEFETRPVSLGFVFGRLAVGEVHLRGFRFLFASIISRMLHIHSKVTDAIRC